MTQRSLFLLAGKGRAFFFTLFLCVSALITPLTAFAAKKADICRTGTLPIHGRIVIRSGLAWMNESAPAFQSMARGLERELASLGLAVTPYAKPSVLEAMPESPLRQGAGGSSKPGAKTPPGASKTPAASTAASGEAAQEKAEALGKDGKLPKLKLRSYGAPRSDADLPQSVKEVRPPDVARAMYARSQELGQPMVRTFAIPGRVPAELASDAAYADYALVVRFASVRSWGEAPGRLMRPFITPGETRIETLAGPGLKTLPAFGRVRTGASAPADPLTGTLVAATTIKGTGALGFGTPASPSSSAPPNTYGTPGGYVRGYEGSAPGDFWGRDRDFYQRDYMFKHGEQPQYATPPKGLSPGVGPGSPGSPGSPDAPVFGGRHTMNIDEWILLFMDCYDLAPARDGQKPVLIWSVSARKPVQGEPFIKGVESLARAAFAANAAKPGPAR